MSQIQTTSLRQQASDLLRKHGDSPKKLMLLHTAVALGASLLVPPLAFG